MGIEAVIGRCDTHIHKEQKYSKTLILEGGGNRI